MSAGQRAGYKKSEVGVIPEEWEVTTLGRHVQITSGESPSFIQFTTTGKPYFKVEQLGNCEKYLGGEATPYHFRVGKAVRGSSIIFAKRGAAISLNRVRILSEDSFMDTNLMALTCLGDLDPEFLYYGLGYIGLWQFADVTSVPQINNKHVKPLCFPLPPIPEQRAIAAALSNMDALLGGLDSLIAKKQGLKVAAMQHLLTGQTRLPGFSGDWEVKRLGDLGSIYGGLIGKTKSDFGYGAARYITFMNVMSNVVIDDKIFDRVNVSIAETQNRTKKGDIFFNGSSETPEEVAMCAVLLEDVQDVYLNSFCFGFRFREDITADGVFFAYYFRSKEGRELIKSLAQGSTRYNLSKVALLNSSFRLPAQAEQTAIAVVLSDMDTELAALQARRSKTQALKHAMMQELLTGRIRLI